jgi:cysteine desulfurase/selenocysteine lyase
MNNKDFLMTNKFIYLDNASGTLKPTLLNDASSYFYNNLSVNPHSIESAVGSELAQVILETRQKIAKLVEAKSDNVVFNSGSTQGLNQLAHGLAHLLNKGDEILISKYNHASAIVPFLEIAIKAGAKVIYSENILEDLNSKTKIAIYAQVNNTLFIKKDQKQIYDKCKVLNTFLINDATQAVRLESISIKNSDALVFSSNKLYGPTGLGFLIMQSTAFEVVKPIIVGSGVYKEIKNNEVIYHDKYRAFETGTPNTAAIYSFNDVLDYLDKLGLQKTYLIQNELNEYLYKRLSSIKNIKLYSKPIDHIALFNIGNHHPQDVVSFLGHNNIIVRGGKLCAPFLYNKYGDVIRVSVAFYNTKNEIDKLVEFLEKEAEFLSFV